MNRKISLRHFASPRGLLVLGLMFLVGCGDGPTEPDELSVADFVGLWEATQFEFTSQANSAVSFDLIGIGGVFQFSVQPQGNFTGSLVLPAIPGQDPQGGPITIPLGGVLRLYEPGRIRIDFIPEIPPLLTTLTPSYTYSVTSLSLTDESALLDFDSDGREDPATLHGTFVRR